jgi:hypothetical protein
MTYIERVESALVSALDKAKGLGWTLRKGVTIDVDRRQCCVLGSLYAAGVAVAAEGILKLGLSIGLDRQQSGAIASGWDSADGVGTGIYDPGHSNGHAEFFALGAKLTRIYSAKEPR